MRLFLLLIITGAVTISAAAQGGKKKAVRLTREADLILIVEVEKRLPGPSFYSGYMLSTHEVSYRVVEVLKGEANSGEIDVGFILVAGDPLADTKKPQLSPIVFKPGNQHILFINYNEGEEHCKRNMPADESRQYYAIDQNKGIVPATPENIEAVEQALLN